MKYVLFAVVLMGLSGCGVKGDPEPPLTRPKLGRGKATFSEVTEELANPPKNNASESETEEQQKK